MGGKSWFAAIVVACRGVVYRCIRIDECTLIEEIELVDVEYVVVVELLFPQVAR